MNRLILILCCWLLKKTLVITTNLTNPESAPDYIFKKVTVNVSKKIRKLWTTYGRDNTKQAEMLYFHCGPSKQEKKLIKLDQTGEKITLKNK